MLQPAPQATRTATCRSTQAHRWDPKHCTLIVNKPQPSPLTVDALVAPAPPSQPVLQDIQGASELAVYQHPAHFRVSGASSGSGSSSSSTAAHQWQVVVTSTAVQPRACAAPNRHWQGNSLSAAVCCLCNHTPPLGVLDCTSAVLASTWCCPCSPMISHSTLAQVAAQARVHMHLCPCATSRCIILSSRASLPLAATSCSSASLLLGLDPPCCAASAGFQEAERRRPAAAQTEPCSQQP